MLLLAALAASVQSQATSVQAQARTTVRIARAGRVTGNEWEKLPPNRRREVVLIENGRKLTIRLIEFE